MKPWIDSARLEVLPGDGVVGRWPGVVFILGAGDDAPHALFELLGAEDLPPPEALRDRIEAYDGGTPVAVVLEQAGSSHVWVFSSGIECWNLDVAVGAGAGETVEVAQSLSLGATAPSTRQAPHPAMTLVEGLVPGSGAVLHRVPRSHGAVAPHDSVETGWAVFDDGSEYLLDRNYVLGRDIDSAGNAEPITLVDIDNSVSRKHAELQSRDGVVLLTDLGSTNGTHLLESDDQWSRLVPNVPTTLSPGTRVAVGSLQFVYEVRTSAD